MIVTSSKLRIKLYIGVNIKASLIKIRLFLKKYFRDGGTAVNSCYLQHHHST